MTLFAGQVLIPVKAVPKISIFNIRSIRKMSQCIVSYLTGLKGHSSSLSVFRLLNLAAYFNM